MRIELLIEPRRSPFMHSDTQEIGSCTVSAETVPILMLAVAGATIEWPGPSHAGLFSFGVEKARTLAASANPVTPEEEIDTVVQQIPEVQQQ